MIPTVGTLHDLDHLISFKRMSMYRLNILEEITDLFI